MDWTSALWLRIRALFRRRELDRNLEDELAFHLAMRGQKYQTDGMSAREAQQAARRAFGNVAALKESARTQWTFATLESFWQDVRYAVRMMAKSPGLTTVVVLSLALGIGANTAIFSVVNAVMLRMLPVREPEQLVLLNWSASKFPEKVIEDIQGSGGKDPKTGKYNSYSFSSASFEYLRGRNQVFSMAFAFAANSDRENVGLNGHADSAEVQAVSGDYFQGLGLTPVLGRVLLPSDDHASASQAAMISYRFWQQKLGGDRSVVGRSIAVNSTPVTIVGVAPAEFFGTQPGVAPEIWIPLSLYAAQSLRIDNYDLVTPKVWWLGIIGRLKPGVTVTEARAQLGVLFKEELRAAAPSSMSDADLPSLGLIPASRGLNDLRDEFSTSLALLMAMVGVVLLVACANVAGLLLAKATARRREIAVRLSLGAPRGRIIRQLLTESVLLAMSGGALGLLVAHWVRAVITTLVATGRNAITVSLEPDLRVLAFTAGVSVVCGVLFGLAPALRATRVEVFPTLKQTAGTIGGHKFRSGKILVGGQVALSLLLLISAGLLIVTLQRLQHVDLGFDPRNLVTFRVQPGLNGYKGERLANYYQEFQRRIRAIPGVRAAGFSQNGTIASGYSQGAAVIPGYSESNPEATVVAGVPGKRVRVWRHWIGPGYFEALGVPVLLGRGIGSQDVQSAQSYVAVVNQQVVRKYFRGDNPIGHELQMNGGITGKRGAVIVGVVKDTKYGELRDEMPPTAYFSYLQRKEYPTFLTYAVRTEGDPRRVIGAIQRQALELDPNVPLSEVRTESEVIGDALSLERSFAVLSSSFGFLALLLACIGLYGTISYTVAQRTNEIGIRIALGAGRESILGMVLRETVLVVTAGLTVGLPLAWGGTRLLKTQLYGISPHDPRTIVISALGILAVTMAAGFLPARRAAHVDPMVALRYE